MWRFPMHPLHDASSRLHSSLPVGLHDDDEVEQGHKSMVLMTGGVRVTPARLQWCRRAVAGRGHPGSRRRATACGTTCTGRSTKCLNPHHCLFCNDFPCSVFAAFVLGVNSCLFFVATSNAPHDTSSALCNPVFLSCLCVSSLELLSFWVLNSCMVFIEYSDVLLWGVDLLDHYVAFILVDTTSFEL